ncbi:MAG: asparagine synthase (glutamine-hydrolyzing) [Oscillospiraceae bacterium]|nr:asparagine synthase (glutamine-hydrolyzing) [Oscillospiraceae bacterium]
MCGIAGLLTFDEAPTGQEAYLAAMSASLAPRGPDQDGMFVQDGCALLHRRLCVVDPKGGIQPMTKSGCTLVYNGELYNAAELRDELQSLGYDFDTSSDTEVVLNSFLCWKNRCAEHFNGIFAFAVYVAPKRTLYLARDPMGVKPLFYAQREKKLIFASELKALLQHPEVQSNVTREALYDIVFLGPGRTPGCGIFKDVFELLPGVCAQYDDTGLSLRQYWRLCDGECQDTFEQAAETTRYLVTNAIQRQLVSDVPLCTFLSGGLDSSIISSVARKELGDLTTYSVDYRDNDRYFRSGKFQPNSDNHYIEIMQQYLGSRHRRVELDTPELVMALFDAVRARDLPGMADVDASMLLLCQSVKHTHTVVLSGECADEIFGGYPWYRDPEIREAAGFPWAQTTDYRASFLRPDYLREETPREYVMRRYAQTIASADILPGTEPLERRMKQMMVLNLQGFMQTLLDRKDRMSMFSGVEVRVPFCDKRIVEYLYTLPWRYKDYHGREKGLLRHAMNDILPQEIVERKKSPYPKTWNPSYHAAVSALLRKELDDPASPLPEIFNRSALEQLLTEQRSLPWYGQLMTTPQTIAYFLQIGYWLRKYHVTIV